MSKLADVVPGAVNAIIGDLEDNLSLGKHFTRKHAQPKGVTPEQTPLLACWLGTSRWQLIATPAVYSFKPRVVVGWYVSGAKSAETGGAGDDELVTDLVEVGDAIAVRLEQLALGVPGLPHLYATIMQTTVDSDDGAVFKVLFELEVEWL